MCSGKKSCEKPRNLIGKPEECSREQIEKCHGNLKTHPCVKPGKKK